MMSNISDLEDIVDERLNSKEFWQVTFAQLSKQFKEGELRAKLSTIDSYFDSAKGKDSLTNVRRNMASALAARRICITMQKYLRKHSVAEVVNA